MPDLSGRVLVAGNSVPDRFLQRLSASGLEVVNPPGSFPPAVLSEAVLTSELSECVACLLGGDEVVTSSVLEVAPNLRVVAFLGVGYESFVDAETARKRGVYVTNTPGAMANSVAEFTIGVLLDAKRRITDYVVANSDHEVRSDLAGHTVGVFGLGAIGTRICEILTLGFGARVRYFSRTRKQPEETRLGIEYSELGDLVRDAEALIVMVPETDETTGIVDRDLLGRRKRDSGLILVNTSRPGLIEPEGLAWALDRGVVESVWFDGFYREESEVTRALASRPEVHITPHVAWLTHEACDGMAAMAVDSILNVLRNGDDSHIVNR